MLMFEKRDYQMFNGTNKEQFYQTACHYWASQGFYVTRQSPYRIQGESFDSRIGLKRKFSLNLHEQEGNTYLDLQFQAKITDIGMFGGLAAAVICLPIALIGGAYSYSEYESDSNDFTNRFWEYMNQIATTTPHQGAE
jgi:hypothetical protein